MALQGARTPMVCMIMLSETQISIICRSVERFAVRVLVHVSEARVAVIVRPRETRGEAHGHAEGAGRRKLP